MSNKSTQHRASGRVDAEYRQLLAIFSSPLSPSPVSVESHFLDRKGDYFVRVGMGLEFLRLIITGVIYHLISILTS